MEELRFDKDNYLSKEIEFRGETIKYREYNVAYVSKPCAPDIQRMNIFVREDMADDHNAPILFVHRDGGVGEARPWSPEVEYEENHTTWSFKGHVMAGALDAPKERESVSVWSLKEGFVLASPGVRGRETEVDGVYVGRGDLPMTLVDLKAAVRYLRYNKGLVPGDPEKIISEGGSSGGGSSASLGASGNSPLFEKYLDEIGAAKAKDDIFCALVDSPIHDFEHIDIAYEWQFGPEFATGLFEGNADKTALSKAARDKYIEYVDTLNLKDPETGEALSIKDGSYTGYMLKLLNESLNVYLSKKMEEEKKEWLESEKNAGLATLVDGKAVINSFSAYINWNAGRWMKYVGCYDGFLDNASRENEAFGTRDGANGHFSVSLAEAIGSVPGFEEEARAWKEDALKKAKGVYMINPYTYILGKESSDIAPLWYLRDGGHHETTGCICLNLALALKNNTDKKVDFRYCWQQNHTSISIKEFAETLVFLNKWCR